MSALAVSLTVPCLAEGNAYAGKMRFGICSQCHGPDGRGLESISTPRLAGQRPYYLKRQLQNFQKGIRGTHSEDEKGKMMRPMAMTLEDEQAIDDVIAYIVTLPE
tara:strand:+ start:5764 stop:6078 length:315 start_codon:yes stop_codon:yes gene_type:complete